MSRDTFATVTPSPLYDIWRHPKSVTYYLNDASTNQTFLTKFDLFPQKKGFGQVLEHIKKWHFILIQLAIVFLIWLIKSPSWIFCLKHLQAWIKQPNFGSPTSYLQDNQLKITFLHYQKNHLLEGSLLLEAENTWQSNWTEKIGCCRIASLLWSSVNKIIW